MAATVSLGLGVVHAQSPDQTQARAEHTRAQSAQHAQTESSADDRPANAAARKTHKKAAGQGQGQGQGQAAATKPRAGAADGRQGAAPTGPQTARRQPTKAQPARTAKARPAGETKPAATAGASDGKPAAAPLATAAEAQPPCRLGDNEQPRGGRLDVLGKNFGTAPVVRIAGRPARILVREQDRISVQVPADSDGGEITLLDDGKVSSCGKLVIIGKDR